MQEKPALKLHFQAVRKLILTVLLLSFTFSAGYLFGYKGFIASASGYPKVTINRELPSAQKELNFSLFWKVWDTMQDKYYDKSKLVQANMVYGAIQGMVAAVGDPYSMFLPPEQNKVVEDDLHGNFSGVGIEIGFKENQMAVTAPLPGSPAEKAGVMAGDLIVGIKDEAKKISQSTQSMNLNDAVKIIRGTSGTKVTLVLVREGSKEPFEVELTRQTIEVPSVKLDYVGESKDIAHIKIQKFGAETVEEWNKAVVDVITKPQVKDVIVDVRNNPGGYMAAAIDIASDFLSPSQVVVIEDHGNGQKIEHKSAAKPGRLRDKKLVILINGGSASASEILSGAMRDNLGTKLIGVKSFGKGTIQEPLTLDDGAGLHVTIAKWLTPKETWVHGNGFDPDVEVKDDKDKEGDEQLQKAIEVVQGL
jgi:carboxyl-terminal processing protease